MILTLFTLQLYSFIPQKISQSGGYFVGENLPIFPHLLPLHYSLFFVHIISWQHCIQGLENLLLKLEYKTPSPSPSFP